MDKGFVRTVQEVLGVQITETLKNEQIHLPETLQHLALLFSESYVIDMDRQQLLSWLLLLGSVDDEGRQFIKDKLVSATGLFARNYVRELLQTEMAKK